MTQLGADYARGKIPLITVTALALVAGCGEDTEVPEVGEYAALVRGQLATADLDRARADHDSIAMQGEQTARDAGDFAHTVLLGTTMLDSIENEFLAIDRWTDPDAMADFYADPMTREAFGSLFASPPTVELFALAPEWVGWGDMRSGEPHDPHFVHLALGTLAASDSARAQEAHDQVASGGKQPSIDAGNVAHVVFLGLEDPRRFVAVDIWASADNIEPFYTNPDFRAAFEPLFESVTEPVYQSTDWYQW